MYRTLVALAAAATVGSLSLSAPATAGVSTDTVSISSFSFAPEALRVAQGATVTWTNLDPTLHTVTSDVGLFDTGDIAAGGGTASLTFDSAGRFRYHCLHHSFMRASVVVPLVVDGGSAADGWKLRWATGAAPDGVAYDVQFKKADSTTWRNLRQDTTHAGGKLNPSAPGDYVVRARTSNTALGEESGWSPKVPLTIS